MRRHLILGTALAIATAGLTTLASQSRPDYPFQPVPFTSVHLNDVFWAPRIETNRKVTIPVGVPAVRADAARLSLRARGQGAARRAARRHAAARLSVRRHRRLQGDRRRVLHAERPPRSEARRLRRRPDREDRRRAGAGRLHLHDAHDQPEGAASLGGPGALGARARRQPRALQPRPPVRGRRRAPPRRPARRRCSTSRPRPPICWSRRSVPASARPGRAIRSPRWRWSGSIASPARRSI